MVEQHVEMYDMYSDNAHIGAWYKMEEYISLGWKIRHMCMTPGFDGYNGARPKMHVVYEREVDTNEKNGIDQIL